MIVIVSPFFQDYGTVEERLREYPSLEHFIGEEGARGNKEKKNEDGSIQPTKKVCSILTDMYK